MSHLVSVIIRSTDRPYLTRALQSVAAQTWDRLEIVVVNALGSAHRPLEDTCGRFPLRVIGKSQPLHRSAAANAGLEAASGSMILFLDDDDWIAPNHLAVLVEALAASPLAIAAYSGVDCIEGGENGIQRSVRVYDDPYDSVRLLAENYIPLHALLFRASAIEKGCRFDEALELFEDWDFWLQLQQHGDFIHKEGVRAYYRIYKGAGQGVVADNADAVRALRKLLDKWRFAWTTDQLQSVVARIRQFGPSEKERTRLERELTTQREESARCYKTLEHARNDLVQVRHDLAQARKSSDELQARFDWVTHSISWRITRPLRDGHVFARKAVQRVAGGLWKTSVWIYRQDRLQPLLQRIPYSVKQHLRALLQKSKADDSESDRLGISRGQPEISGASMISVSIVIPVYNHGEYLEQCISSALGQTYGHTEVIVVDDASPDPGVRRILDKYAAHPLLKLLYNEQNMGISKTQNRALIASSGDVIAFLDCDDYLAPDAVQKCIAAWRPETVYMHTGRINIDSDGREINRISFEHLPRKDYFAENLERMFATHFKLIRRDVFAHVGLFDPRFDSAQDYDMLMRIAFHYSSEAFLHLPVFVYNHRLHSGQATEQMSGQQSQSTLTVQYEARLRRDIRLGKFEHFISIIMLSFGKHSQTLAAIRSLVETVHIPHEIILFDNGSDAETVEFIKAHIDGHYEHVKVIYNDSNLGPAAGRQQAMRHAAGEWFIVFDNDERAEPGWIEELLVRAQTHPNVGAVCCRVIFPDRRLQCTGGYVRKLDDEVVELGLYDQGTLVDDLSSAEFRQLDWSPIGATLFTVSLAEYLHAGYPNVFEDAGVSMALRRQGKLLLNSPGSWVWHDHYMFQKKLEMKKRYLDSRYDPKKMLISVATFYRENGLILHDEYVWRENGLNGLPKQQLKTLLDEQPRHA